MGLDVTTRTVQNLIDRVRRQFGDDSGAQLLDTDIFMWVNAGQLEIVRNDKVLKDKATTSTTIGGETYTFPADNILTIEALFLDGVPLKSISFPDFQENIIGDTDYSPTYTGTPTMYWEWGNELHLYPLPDNVYTLQLFYTKHPTDITAASDTLSIPDVLFDTLVDFVLARAYEMDEDYAAAQYKNNSLEQKFGQNAERESGQIRGTYPVITVLEDDI